MKNIFLGIDGGGTKTACVAIDSIGKIIGQSESGSSNRYNVGDEAAFESVKLAIHLTLDAAAADPRSIHTACVGMAGIGRPVDREVVSDWMETLLPDCQTLIYNDAVISLASGTGGSLHGIVVISGTGMIAFGRAVDGREARAGGWGPILGDGGGGASIGLAILHAITAQADESGPSTALYNAVLHQLGLQNVSDLVAWAYRDDAPWARIASLAPLAARCATSGDGVSEHLLHNAAADLASGAMAVARKLNLLQETFPLVLAGGNLHPGMLHDLLVMKLQHSLPKVDIRTPKVEAAHAAALLALRRADSSMTG